MRKGGGGGEVFRYKVLGETILEVTHSLYNYIIT